MERPIRNGCRYGKIYATVSERLSYAIKSSPLYGDSIMFVI